MRRNLHVLFKRVSPIITKKLRKEIVEPVLQKVNSHYII